jgi:hypothetical protein
MERTKLTVQIIRNAAICYVAVQCLVSFALLYGLLHHDPRMIKTFAWWSALWGPLCLITTALRARTAWRGLPEDDLNDVSYPSLYVFMIAGVVWVALH